MRNGPWNPQDDGEARFWGPVGFRGPSWYGGPSYEDPIGPRSPFAPVRHAGRQRPPEHPWQPVPHPGETPAQFFRGGLGSWDQGAAPSWNTEPRRGPHSGRGPKNYVRSDERIRDEVCERLTYDPEVDASDVDVQVKDGVVTLSGSVPERHQKRFAEELADLCPGVRDVQNSLRVAAAATSERTPAE